MVLFEIFTHTSNTFWINRLVDRDPAIIVSCNTYILGWVFSGRLRRCLGLCVGGGFWLVLWVSDGVEGWDGVGMFTFLELPHMVDAILYARHSRCYTWWMLRKGLGWGWVGWGCSSSLNEIQIYCIDHMLSCLPTHLSVPETINYIFSNWNEMFSGCTAIRSYNNHCFTRTSVSFCL